MRAWQGRHGRIGGQQTQRNGFVASFLAQDIPTLVVLAFVFINKFLGRLEGNVIGLKSHIRKKRLV